MRVLVLGGTGMLGHKLCQVLSRELVVFATFRSAAPPLPRFYGALTPIVGVDASSFSSVERAFSEARPDVVVNAVGVVKQRSTDAVANITLNALLPHQLADLCGASGARLLHLSTDCVFSGRAGNYRESDPPDPVDLYGRSKLLGEIAGAPALTLRTSMIGREIGRPAGLLEWFLANAGGRVRGYARAVFSGLTTRTLAELIARIIGERQDLVGIWHLGSAPIAKYDLLRRLDEVFATGTTVERDESVVCDRSLNADRFWRETSWPRPSWDKMLVDLAADSRAYEEIHARR